jgi:ankyrin repeat protein
MGRKCPLEHCGSQPIMARMSADAKSQTHAPQRWVRPNLDEPGLWRNQLPNKYLAVAVRGDVAGLRAMLKAHPDFLSKRGNHNRTLLWEAARRGRLAAVKWLVEQGAEVDATGCYNSESLVQITPYCAAVYYRRPQVAAYLLSHGGARLDIFRAAFMGEQGLVERALADEPALLHAEDPFDNIYFVPLLAFAVAGGQAALVAFLFEQGAHVGPYTAQLLHIAGRMGRLDLVEQLVARGADLSAADTGIFVAVNDLEIVRYLLAHGVPTNRAGLSGFPPLIFVARGDKSESPEKARLLLENGAEADAVGPRGRTALHYAAAAGHVAVIGVLLEFGADVSVKDEAGATPLALARAAGKTAAVRLLRKTGAQRGGG